MSSKSVPLNAALVERQRQKLLRLRDLLVATSNAAEAEEGNVKSGAILQAREYEDDAQNLDTLEREGDLVSRAVARLARVERALLKITDGTYGYSDVSGERISDARLEAEPEAVDTIAERQASERSSVK